MSRALRYGLALAGGLALVVGLWIGLSGFDHPDESLAFEFNGETAHLRCDLPAFQAFSDVDCSDPARSRLLVSVALIGGGGAALFVAHRFGRASAEAMPTVIDPAP